MNSEELQYLLFHSAQQFQLLFHIYQYCIQYFELQLQFSGINPKIEFNIISNGTLFTKEKVEELDLKKRLNTVIISMHSITSKTYNKLVERGDFNSLIKNVEYLATLKKQGYLKSLQLNFVVTSLNYKEMKNFAKFAKKLEAKAFFINYHRQIDSDSLEKELDVSLSTHPKYNDLVKVLSDPIFNDEGCMVNDYLKNLKPVKRSFFEKISNLFKK